MSYISENLNILPGDSIMDVIESHKDDDKKKIIVGPGLKQQDKNSIIAYKSGQLLYQKSNRFWINSHQRFYIPCERDTVLGIVQSKTSQFCRVDIGAAEPATLSLLAFPNATKRNKGIVEVGDIVFAYVLSAAKDIETELVCMDQDGKKAGLGVLSRGGYMIKIPLNICRRLLSPECEISQLLGQKYRFEKAIGLNGRIWIKSKSMQTTIIIVNFIKQLEYIPNNKQIKICGMLS